MLKVLDFSADSDQEPDSNGEYTSASLDTYEAVPESLTVCAAFMVEAWTTEFAYARLFQLLTPLGDGKWQTLDLGVGPGYTVYTARVG